ncbi:hypothetical protein H2201_002733 [Coniosporium apollinis]|uniref:Uncharacterized protein n=1 Tax=Coniosporium apollinis TaxID=61459 RepID=A0ABQ9NYM1_9PEZI|nr:hypothetical protein H2201_002733 [Coniosporium apollinis]
MDQAAQQAAKKRKEAPTDIDWEEFDRRFKAEMRVHELEKRLKRIKELKEEIKERKMLLKQEQKKLETMVAEAGGQGSAGAS